MIERNVGHLVTSFKRLKVEVITAAEARKEVQEQLSPPNARE